MTDDIDNPPPPAMTAHVRDALEWLQNGPQPRQAFNPGVAGKMERENMVESVNLPSPYMTHVDRNGGQKLIRHLKITPTGRCALEAQPPGPRRLSGGREKTMLDRYRAELERMAERREGVRAREINAELLAKMVKRGWVKVDFGIGLKRYATITEEGRRQIPAFVVGCHDPATNPGEHDGWGIHHRGASDAGDPWYNQIVVYGDEALRDRVLALLNADDDHR